ncbi:MAG: hypothetical protein PHC45_08860 [Clostridiaceae bacterium]|nr:hypothetical protein [Clostridiaceae bacterium]
MNKRSKQKIKTEDNMQIGTIFSSGGNSRYAAILEKVSEIGFLNFYYDNSIGKIIRQYFVWDSSQFVLHSTSEE